MTLRDAHKIKRNKSRVALHPKIIAGIWSACYPGGADEAHSYAFLKIKLKDFAMQSRAIIEKKCKGFYLQWPNGEFGERTVERAMQTDIEKFGATLVLRNFLCCYAFEGRNWRETLGYLGLDEEEQYIEHARLKAELNKKSPSTSAVLIEERFKEKFSNINPKLKTISVAELAFLNMHAPLKDLFGDIDWERIRQRLTVNQNLVKGIISKDSVTGFFIVYPITEVCRHLIEKSKIKKSDDFQLAHICSDFGSASALYISIVYAFRNRWSEANLFKQFREEIANILIAYPNIKVVFTRPITDNGKRLAINKFEFLPLRARGKIRYLNSEDFIWQL